VGEDPGGRPLVKRLYALLPPAVLRLFSPAQKKRKESPRVEKITVVGFIFWVVTSKGRVNKERKGGTND